MNYIKNYSISIGISLLLILILTFITTVFSYFNIINQSIISIIKIIIPTISLLLSGYIIGIKSNKKGWLEGLKLSIISLIILLLFNYLGFNNKFEIKNILYYVILIVSCVFGSMIGISKKKTS